MSLPEFQELEEVKGLIARGQLVGVRTYVEIATATAELDLDETAVEELHGFLERAEIELVDETDPALAVAEVERAPVKRGRRKRKVALDLEPEMTTDSLQPCESSLIQSSLRRRVAGVGARGIGRLTKNCCAGASTWRSRSRLPGRRGCSRRCTDSRKTTWSRSRRARPTSGGMPSGAPAVCRASASGCRPSRSPRRRCPTA
jgi:Sigma-70 factor, region 1.1